MTDYVKLLLRNKIAEAQEQARTYRQCLDEVNALEQENRRLYWLIRNGPRVFGTLWTEASVDDIREAMDAECLVEDNHDWQGIPGYEKPLALMCRHCGKIQE
jgi:hypothetical protein